MKSIVMALALLSVAPVAHAQVFPQPQPPRPGYPLEPVPQRADRDDYWRQHREGEEDWRRREEFREEEHRREEWRRAHCVVDYRGQEYCRR